MRVGAHRTSPCTGHPACTLTQSAGRMWVSGQSGRPPGAGRSGRSRRGAGRARRPPRHGRRRPRPPCRARRRRGPVGSGPGARAGRRPSRSGSRLSPHGRGSAPPRRGGSRSRPWPPIKRISTGVLLFVARPGGRRGGGGGRAARPPPCGRSDGSAHPSRSRGALHRAARGVGQQLGHELAQDQPLDRGDSTWNAAPRPPANPTPRPTATFASASPALSLFGGARRPAVRASRQARTCPAVPVSPRAVGR